jgi:hypothetical protein
MLSSSCNMVDRCWLQSSCRQQVLSAQRVPPRTGRHFQHFSPQQSTPSADVHGSGAWVSRAERNDRLPSDTCIELEIPSPRMKHTLVAGWRTMTDNDTFVIFIAT